MTEPKSPSAWGIQMSKFWTQAGQNLPVKVELLAPEASKRYDDPVGLVIPHGVVGVDGMLSKRKKKGDWCISFDAEVTVPGRINYTLAHEFGHYLCHRGRQSEFRCAEGELLNDYFGETGRKMEKEANVFASYLLMPADDFRRQVDRETVTLPMLGELSSRYATSLTATALKWLELTDEAGLLVVGWDDHVGWSYPSTRAVKNGAYMVPGTPLPEEALRRAGAPSRVSAACRVAPGVWHPTLEADESLIVSDQFDQFIFLVRFPAARLVEHDEEPARDSFDFIADSARGLGWRK